MTQSSYVSVHQDGILVSQVVEGLGGNGGAGLRFAVDVDLRVLIGNLPEHDKLQGAAGDVHGARKMPGGKLTPIADVKEDGLFLRIDGGLDGLGL